MDQLIEIQEQDIVPDAPVVDESNFKKREAARAVVLDDDGSVFLLYVGKEKYHKLPGGGFENTEDVFEALKRELLEEIGCQAEITNELGKVIEHRNQFEQIQTSYCFVARKTGQQVDPSFDEGELELEFRLIKVPSLEAAIKTLENDNPENYMDKFVNKRDLVILKAAKEILQV